MSIIFTFTPIKKEKRQYLTQAQAIITFIWMSFK